MATDPRNGSTVLPEPGKRNVLVTSALPYVNNIPHLGNIIGSVLSGDTFARYCRGCGINTLYVGGTDEYGTTTEARALAEGCIPKELCGKYRVIHADVYKWFSTSFDIFGWTTIELQTEVTQDIFLSLNRNGLLKECQTTQLYCECPACAYPDARGDQYDLCGRLLDTLQLKNPRCKVDGSVPITKEMNHDGLEPRSITRDMKWGTRVPPPGYEDKVIYPWFDACIGYWEKWWRNPKDTKLHHLSTTEYLTYGGGEFSKSRNIGVFGDSAQKTGVASDFTCDSFISDNSNLLLEKLGNFYHDDSFDTFEDDIAKLLSRYIQELDAVNLRSGLSTVLAISQQGNGFLQSNKLDGNLFNTEPSKCAVVVGIAVDLVHLPASLLAPYMPDTANSINKRLRADPLPIPDCWSADSIMPGHKIGKAEHLFRPIKPEKTQEWRKAFGADEAKKTKEEDAALKVPTPIYSSTKYNLGGVLGQG
ncbi:methionyl-tRNA synthetase [Xylaria grammica]|nr:methionyl-tRNA synthetase [Xylaria grammica]